jgi:hypothetical protein
MKLIAFTVVGIGVIGGILLNVPYTATHTQESTEVEITALPEVVEVDVIEKRIADAQAEAMDSINEKADAMRGEFVANELKKIEAEVLAEIEKEIKTRRVDVEKQTGAY